MFLINGKRLTEGVKVGDVKVEEHAVDNEQLNKVKVSNVEGDVNVIAVPAVMLPVWSALLLNAPWLK